jgi:hypothetical protein
MPRVAPMYETNAALFGSTGAAETSTFHQFVGGNSGSGAGSAPPRTGCPRAAAARERKKSAGNQRRFTRFIVGTSRAAECGMGHVATGREAVH